MRERQVFDPDSIRLALEGDLADGLRALADAIESQDIDGRLIGVTGNGFSDWRDTRSHVWVTIDVAAQVFRWTGGEKLPLDNSPMLELPISKNELQS